MSETEIKKMSLTVLLPAGRLPLPIMNKAYELAIKYNLELYLSTAQNLRILEVPETAVAEFKRELGGLGADFKAPGKFPVPRVCVGKPHCNLGVIDTKDLSSKILDRFKGRETTKPKFKIAISGCILSCSGSLLTDLAVVATQKGLDLYVGGKGGPYPKVGRRVLRDASEADIIDAIETLVEFHDKKTGKKQRMAKLLEDPEFPFPETV